MLYFLPSLRGQRKERNQWDPCLSMSYIVFSPFQRNNGEHASKGPCRPGFSQSFYSVLISRDVLRGQAILRGETFNWPFTSFTYCTEDLQCEWKSFVSAALRASVWEMCMAMFSFNVRSCSFHISAVAFAHMENGCKTKSCDLIGGDSVLWSLLAGRLL